MLNSCDWLPVFSQKSLKRGFENIELGGMSAEQKKEYRDCGLKTRSCVGPRWRSAKSPWPVANEADLGAGNYRAKAAQVAGVVGADLASDGMRNIWWFLNAPSGNCPGRDVPGHARCRKEECKFSGLHEQESLIRNRNLRMAAAAPAWIATSMGIGNFMRQPGYKATSA